MEASACLRNAFGALCAQVNFEALDQPSAVWIPNDRLKSTVWIIFEHQRRQRKWPFQKANVTDAGLIEKFNGRFLSCCQTVRLVRL